MKRIGQSFNFLLSTVILLITMSVNAQYQIHSDQAMTVANTPVVINVRANDTYPFQYQTVSFTVNGVTHLAPTNGTLQFIGDDVVYTPNPGFVGTDGFMYALSNDGVTLFDSAYVYMNVLADTDPNFHINMAGIPPASCNGGQLKVFMKNGVAPYVYQINGSAVTTTLSDSIIVNNFISHTGTIQVTDANNVTVNTEFTIPNNRRLLCIDGPTSGYTLPNECLGNVSFGVWGGTPPFFAIGTSMQGPEQVSFMWEGNDSHSRRAFASNVCQGFYNLLVTDSNGVQATSTFMMDTNTMSIPPIVTSIDTCIAITGYTDAFVSDVYTNSNGTYAVWNIVLLSTDTITLDVLYPIQTPATYQFILYVNCPGGKSTVMLTDYYTVTYSDLILSVVDNFTFEDILVHPNPLKDIANIYVNAKKTSLLQINVFNLMGERVSSQKVNVHQGKNAIELNVSPLPKGTYILQLVDESFVKTNRKVVKM